MLTWQIRPTNAVPDTSTSRPIPFRIISFLCLRISVSPLLCLSLVSIRPQGRRDRTSCSDAHTSIVRYMRESFIHIFYCPSAYNNTAHYCTLVRRSIQCSICVVVIYKIIHHCCYFGDALALLLGHRTCDLQVAGSSPGWAPLRNGSGQATYTCVPLSPSSIIWFRPMG